MSVIIEYKKIESVTIEILADNLDECGIISAASCGLGVKVEIDEYCDHYQVLVGPFHDESDAMYFHNCAEEALKSTGK